MGEQALELSRKAAALLIERGFAQGRLESELLLSGVLGIERLQLYLQHDRPVALAELERFRAFVRRRLKHEPLQYILGEAHFRQLRLQVDRRVLVPRPETEVLAGEVLRWAAARGAGVEVLEIGTGSGAIALSLAQEGSFERVVASDISPDALAVAAANAARHGLAERVEFRCGRSWDVVGGGEHFDAVVSNAPYVSTAEYAALAPEVQAWEPAGALLGGEDGLSVIRELAEGAPARLRTGGLLALEIGELQGPAVLALLSGGCWSRARIAKDLAGRDRMVLAELAGGLEA